MEKYSHLFTGTNYRTGDLITPSLLIPITLKSGIIIVILQKLEILRGCDSYPGYTATQRTWHDAWNARKHLRNTHNCIANGRIKN